MLSSSYLSEVRSRRSVLTIFGTLGMLQGVGKYLAGFESVEPLVMQPSWKFLPSLPDSEGFAGMFAGVISGKLVVGGGANFPEGYPWEGGKKRWYDHIFVLDSPESNAWRRLKTRLPKPAAYGVSFGWNDRLVIAGGETGPAPGEDPDRSPQNLAEVLSLRFECDELRITEEAPLPEPIKDGCGVTIDDRLFLFGGIDSASAVAASNRLYVLDMKEHEQKWRKGPDLPAGGRVQSVAATDGEDLFVFSGIEIVKGPTGSPLRKTPYLREVWRYRPGTAIAEGRWTRRADMPREAAASPSPAIVSASGEMILASGASAADHARPQKGHKGWSHSIMTYDPANDRWKITENGIPPGRAVVTAPCVKWHDRHVIVSGEIAPGRRTPFVIAFEGR